MVARVAVAIALCCLLVVLLAPPKAMAQPAGGKMPLSNFFRDLYEEGVGTYVPVICFLVIVTYCCNMAFGWMEIGAGVGRMILIVAILGGGVAYISGLVGANVAAATLPMPPLP